MSVGRAVVTGMFWVNGSALLAFGLPIVVAVMISSMTEIDQVADAGILIGMVLILVLSFVSAWLAWSVQVPRWRVWAYRRVKDIEALKAAAVSAGLIWPEGHFFQRTELRTSAQADEIFQLEEAATIRKIATVADGTPGRTPTLIGTAFKALVFGLICTPLCMLAPAGALSWVGIEITGSPIYWGVVAAFPVLVAALIYRRARQDGVTADEGFRRTLPRGIRREGEVS
jgi:hypothetical protein